MSQITDLAKRIADANVAYRNNTPIMSDAAFDKLEDELRVLDPTNAHFTKVGAAAPSGGSWPKAAHAIPMGSLRKCQFDPDVGDGHSELKAWWPGKPVCITHKLDGISCFDGDTPIHLANGETMTIKEIVDKSLRPQILTWIPEDGVVTRQVINAFDNGERENWVRLTLDGGDGTRLGSQIVVTEDHKFYVSGKGWICARDLLGEDLQDYNE